MLSCWALTWLFFLAASIALLVQTSREGPEPEACTFPTAGHLAGSSVQRFRAEKFQQKAC